MTEIVLSKKLYMGDREVRDLKPFDLFDIEGSDHDGGFSDTYMCLGKRMSNPKTRKYDSIWVLDIHNNTITYIVYDNQVTYVGKASKLTIDVE